MEISRKNQWVEEDDGGIPGNVAQSAKVRKGRDAARGRWKSTEHVNEVGRNKHVFHLIARARILSRKRNLLVDLI